MIILMGKVVILIIVLIMNDDEDDSIYNIMGLMMIMSLYKYEGEYIDAAAFVTILYIITIAAWMIII
jgi:hypothetical protein